MKFSIGSAAVLLYFALSSSAAAVLESRAIACPTATASYDYIIVGAGAGGGPLASRLALAGYKVLVLEHGRDVVNYNTTVPLYLGKASDDPQLSLDYNVTHNPAISTGSRPIVKWYPRASGLGGSTVHNALVNVLQTKYDWDTLASSLGDKSWSDENMRRYFQKLENNLYLDPSVGTPAGHGYSGWLSTDYAPSNLLLDPQYYDPQLIDVATGIQNMTNILPLAEHNSIQNEGVPGGAFPVLTKDSTHQRSSVRDFLYKTQQALPTRLTIKYEAMATKILTCDSSTGVKAYGVEAALGANLLPVSRLFAGKAKSLVLTTYTAKYEVIVSAGVFQTPQLLKLSGIGPSAELTKYGIPVRANLAGVGENLVDRIEISVVWKLKAAHVLFNGCKFGNDPATDPCLKDWIGGGHTNLYSAGPAFWQTSAKSSPSLPYVDMMYNWAPAQFKGYYRNYEVDIANNPDILSSILLKGHTSARGYVRLTSADPQDVLDINKNLYATTASQNDRVVLRNMVKNARAMVASQPLITSHILSELWPGPSVSTDDQIDSFINQNAWGHHACCTAKIGVASDATAVLDSNFNVRGVANLRVVDISVFPDIPGLFVTTPIYMVSEKAADVILATAKTNGWTPTA